MTVRDLYLILKDLPENAVVVYRKRDVEIAKCVYEAPQCAADFTFGTVHLS